MTEEEFWRMHKIASFFAVTYYVSFGTGLDWTAWKGWEH